MTKAERSQINRDNAKKSTGPKTEAGKAVSRQNATTHGMRAKALPLPDEDPAEIQAKHDAYNEHYNPQSPAEQELVNQAVHASIQSARCLKFQHAVVSKQVRDAKNAHDNAVCDELERLKTLLNTEPARAVRLLSRFAVGCQWLSQQWQRLRAKLVADGAWDDGDRDLACQLFGIVPGLERLPIDATLYMLVLYNFLATTSNQDEPLWDVLCSPEMVPAVLRRTLAKGLPNAETARAYMLGEVDRTLGDALALGAELQPLAEADREEAGDRALLIEDGPVARLLLRYQSEARTSFHRAYSALEKAKKEADSALADAVSPNEPNDDRWIKDYYAMKAELEYEDFPNEPNDAPPVPATPELETTCVEPTATVSEAPTACRPVLGQGTGRVEAVGRTEGPQSAADGNERDRFAVAS